MNSARRPGAGRPAARRRLLGFTLVELMLVVVVVAVLASIALPSYREYIRRSSREATQSQLIEMAGIQEKIFLNSNAYANNVAAPYDGKASGGLGAAGGKSLDGRYLITATVSGASYVLTATPVAGGPQDGDGVLTIASDGKRTWGSKTW
ncbi:type IV pilin protein [Piscinibacter sakaiensis]|uniref:type IV pilin protein n=1 Tax=Piscinibacter sakaiensis TaxID=1547922 RepID=UPI003AADCD8E